MFKIYTREDNILSETSNKEHAHIFAQMFSAGSEDYPSSEVWIYEVISDAEEKAISWYSGGVRYDRV